MISSLVGYVRFRHILPVSNSSVLNTAIQRGLVDNHVPIETVMSLSVNGANTRSTTGPAYWLSSFNHPEYVNPRFFTNYLAEAKVSFKCLNQTLKTVNFCFTFS